MSYSGWLLPEKDRERLMAIFSPRFPKVIAHHVTLKYPADETDPLPVETKGFVIGYASDGIGIEALVVEIGGTSRRHDGSVYHITWSLDPEKGYSPKMSNDLLQSRGFRPLKERIKISLEPKLMK